MCNTDFLKPLGELKEVRKTDFYDRWTIRGYCRCDAKTIADFKPECALWYYRATYTEHGNFFFHAEVLKASISPTQSKPQPSSKD